MKEKKEDDKLEAGKEKRQEDKEIRKENRTLCKQQRVFGGYDRIQKTLC